MRTGLQAITGDGSRLALGAAGNFVGTRDGFFHGGHLARLAGTTLEGRYGQAGGFGWDRAASFAFNRPVNDLSWAPGLRINLSRAARNGYSTYASSVGDLGRAGGLQHVSGALCNAGFTPQLMRLGLPMSYEEETTSTYRGQPCWSASTLALPRQSHVDHPLVGPGQATGVTALTQSLRCGDALQQNYGLSFGLRYQQTHTLRQAKTWRCGINFDRFTPMWLPRLRLQTLWRDARVVELSKLGPAANGIRLERSLRREHRAMLSVPFGRLADFFSSFLASLLPQAWFTWASERRIETKLVAQGSLRSNRRWHQIAAAWRDDAAHPAPNQGSLDDALDAEVARLHTRSRTSRKLALEGVMAEERQEKRGKLCVPLNYLPLRAANATQFFEVSYGQGRRASVTDPQAVALAKTGRTGHGERPFRRSYQTFRDVTYERHQQTRLSNQTEVRASWEAGNEPRIAQLSLSSTWTFNAKNEAFSSYAPEAMREAFGAVNGLFGAELLAPDATPVHGECRVRSAYALSRAQVQQLCTTLRAAPNVTPDAAKLLAPGCLAELRRRLTEGKTEADNFEAVADFVTRARRLDAPGKPGSTTEMTPAPVLAMALLHQLVVGAPRVATKVEHYRRIPALEQAHAVVARYDDGPLDGQMNAYQLRERLAAGLLAIHNIEVMQAPGAPRAYFDVAGARHHHAEVKRLTQGLYRVLDVGETGGHRHAAVLDRLQKCPLSAEELALLARCIAEQYKVASAPKLALPAGAPVARQALRAG